MRSGSNVTKTLLEFSSVWHGVCSYWNENICSVEICVAHPPTLPTVIPLPCPRRGYPIEYGGTVAHGNFYPKNGKPQGGYPFWKGFMGKNLRNGKNSGGGTRFGRGFMGEFLGMGKFREGVPVLEGGLSGNLEEREKRRLEPIKKGKTQEGVPFRKGVYRGNLE